MRVQCCFCGRSVENAEMGLTLTVGSPKDDETQVPWCHNACFAHALHPSVPVLHEDASVILMPLEDEGVEVWRPVHARKVGDGRYEVSVTESLPSEEKWRFQPGSTVTCELRRLSDGSVGLIATSDDG